VKIIVNAVVGTVLFGGSFVGVLAATGRLNHEGTANIPLLNKLFPPPPPSTDGSDKDSKGKDAKDAAATKGATKTADAGQQGQGDASKQEPEKGGESGKGEPDPGAAPQVDSKPRQLKKGRSLFAVDDKTDEGKKDEGKKEGGKGEPEKNGGREGKSEGASAKSGKDGEHLAEQDMASLQDAHERDRSPHGPGNYFRFDGMPAGIDAEKLNEAWQRVQTVEQDQKKRVASLDLREQELQSLEQDVARRQTELGRERAHLETLQKELDNKIEAFRQQVKIVHTDELPALKRNAATLASFEPAKAAELVVEQWKQERGQEQVLRTFEVMDTDAVNAILAVLPNQMIRDVLEKRLKIVREPEKKK
jgi:hypothetical protein